MRVTVKLGEPVWRAVGQRKVQVEAPGADCTLPELLERLEAAYPQLRAELRGDGAAADRGGVDYHFTFFLSDRMVKPADMAGERVTDGEELMIVLPMAGG
jgi:hypothetical protein